MDNYCMYSASGGFICSADNEGGLPMNKHNNCYKAKASDDASCDCRKSNCIYGFCRCNESHASMSKHNNKDAVSICNSCRSCGDGTLRDDYKEPYYRRLSIHDESNDRMPRGCNVEYMRNVNPRRVVEKMERIYPKDDNQCRLTRDYWAKYKYNNYGPNPAYHLPYIGPYASNKMYGMNFICDLDDNRGRCGMWNDMSVNPNYIDKMKDPRNRNVVYSRDPLPDETLGYFPSTCGPVRCNEKKKDPLTEGFRNRCEGMVEKCRNNTLLLKDPNNSENTTPYTSRKNVMYENREMMTPAPINPSRYQHNQDMFYGTAEWRKRFGVDVNYPCAVDIHNMETKIYDERRREEEYNMNNMRNLGTGCLITPLKECMTNDIYDRKMTNRMYGTHDMLTGKLTTLKQLEGFGDIRQTGIVTNLPDSFGNTSWDGRFGPHNLMREQNITKQNDMTGVYDKKMVNKMYGTQDMSNGPIQDLKQLEGMRNIRDNDIGNRYRDVQSTWCHRYGPNTNVCGDTMSADEYYQRYGFVNDINLNNYCTNGIVPSEC